MGYLERAQLVGHDGPRLKSGETIRSTVLIDSIDKFKAIFAAASAPEQRAEFSRTIETMPWGAQFGNFPDAPMTRLLSHIFGDGDLTAADAEFANSLFPLKINAVSGQTVTVSTAIVYGPSGPPTVVNVGTLVFAGGSITAENTVLDAGRGHSANPVDAVASRHLPRRNIGRDAGDRRYGRHRIVDTGPGAYGGKRPAEVTGHLRGLPGWRHRLSGRARRPRRTGHSRCDRVAVPECTNHDRGV